VDEEYERGMDAAKLSTPIRWPRWLRWPFRVKKSPLPPPIAGESQPTL
jgi:hypothetical protein